MAVGAGKYNQPPGKHHYRIHTSCNSSPQVMPAVALQGGMEKKFLAVGAGEEFNQKAGCLHMSKHACG